MKNKIRALRRFHRNRLVRRYMNYNIVAVFSDNSKKAATRLVDHITSCSCSVCGNQRHNYWLNKQERLSIQERQAIDNFKCEMDDILTTL